MHQTAVLLDGAAVARLCERHAAEIRDLAKRTVEGVVGIGQRLIEVKSYLQHGAFGPWIDAEFGWSDETTRRFMQTAQLASENPQIVEFNIDLSALYLLANPATPEPARAVLLGRAEAGERITHKVAQAAIGGPAPRRPRPAPIPDEHRPDPQVQRAADIIDFLCRVPFGKYEPEAAAEFSDPEMVEAIDRYFDQAGEWFACWSQAWRTNRNAKRRG